MSPNAAANALFVALETGTGWQGCKDSCHRGASFSYQTEPAIKTMTLASYAEWMRVLLKSLPGARYVLKSFTMHVAQGADFAKVEFYGTDFGVGGPIPPFGNSVAAEYAYIIEFYDNKIFHLTKVWTDIPEVNSFGRAKYAVAVRPGMSTPYRSTAS
jgi:hypothetical protein